MTKDEQVEQAQPGRDGPPFGWVVAAFAAIYVIWGSTYLGIRYGVETIPPFLMAGSRFLVAGLILYAFAFVRSGERPSLRQWRVAAVAGALMLLLGNGGVTWAEQVIPSSVAALLVALTPLWMVLMDWARPRGVRPSNSVIQGLVVGFLGVAVLTSGQGRGQGTFYAWGVAALMLASMCWAWGSLYTRHADKPKSALLSVAMQMITGGALLMLAGVLAGELHSFSWSRISTGSAVAWLYLTIAGSLIGFPAYVWLLQVSTPARVSTYAYVNPFIAVLLGCTIGREPLSSNLFIAGALIIVAVALIVRGRSKPSPKADLVIAAGARSTEVPGR
ncbi:MAG TPA: EamA family transporter [Verrucomicrobia bacterium]|nr:EamA family transporter [Verrucomicrobiota bacterium]HOP96757.1 EamA family transporter [Verrucomicrobiota bacterium]